LATSYVTMPCHAKKRTLVPVDGNPKTVAQNPQMCARYVTDEETKKT
jgi:hypothetical protein